MPRVLLLLPTTTYRTKAFLDAALKLGIDVTAASERPSTLADKNPAGLLTLSFLDPERASRQAQAFASQYPVDAIIPVDEDTAVVAAYAARALGLRHNPVESAIAAKNKHRMREILKAAGVRVPGFWHFTLDEDTEQIAKAVSYPCVVKPVFLSTSRGVMRADDPGQFVASVRRLESILARPEVAGRGGTASREILVEQFVPGVEVAVEALLTDNEFRVLTIFDKPDPLDGPFFEETIYVTPSRLPAHAQEQIAQATAVAVRAMGLIHGPVHAELRINEQGPWIIEIAARAIGGMCSRALRFGSGVSLEEIILRNALRQNVDSIRREEAASGVMMIPIPEAGILKGIAGLDEARSVRSVDDISITAHISQRIAPPPEGASYLGFIFSHAPTPGEVEEALREAHSRLEFKIEKDETGAGSQGQDQDRR